MSTIWLVIIILVFSAFFSGMEIAFVTSNKLRFELDKKQKGLASSIISIFYKHPQQYISTMLVGNNICLVVYGILMANMLTPYLLFLKSQFLITLAQTILATIIVLITGEFLPKTIFRANPNLWLNIFSPILLIFYIVLYPISSISTWLSILILRIFGIKRNKEAESNTFSRIDFNYLVEESFDGSNTEEEIENEVKILQNALDFSNVKLRDCYVPRPEIIALDHSVDVETLKQTFIETGLSKIIIYKGDIDNVVGYIHSSEMFTHQNNWKEHINKIPIVPENMAAQKLMKTFMQEKKSIAVVVDEFGGTAGIITLEDIIEQIFGEIEDEHDTHEYISERINESEYLFSGRLEVKTINSKYNLNIPESDEYDTIAGFILFHYQHFPKLNEVIRIGAFTLKCTKITNSRIDLVRLSIYEE
ncbi:HlyC/CorC family transporter [Paludibacter sp. 221]|uniref:hemolysin family protein n=1 Tax=Paludibacter sp. 221 TaxID=2302939 RepID=UPI0013D7A75B|nr:hemolysin family protein [Paludibacter sp. 221]NDV47381.1 HlyC/CorC family transporter [Paludibacter sp. 221]